MDGTGEREHRQGWKQRDDSRRRGAIACLGLLPVLYHRPSAKPVTYLPNVQFHLSSRYPDIGQAVPK